jgi:hypothetical protein
METPLSDRFELRHAASDRVLPVKVPSRRLLAIAGFGPPGTPDYLLALRALRLADQAVRAALSAAGWTGLVRGAAECMWQPPPEVPSASIVGSFVGRTDWRWQQLVELPRQAGPDDAAAAIDRVREGAGRERPLIHVVEARESEALQILSVGGPTAEADALRRLVDAMAADGVEGEGAIHQLFVSDPERVPRDRWRSILRVPIVRAAQRPSSAAS